MTLTPRQHQIVALVVKGHSNKAIARILNITEGTVKVHLHQIFERFEVTNRTQLAYAFQNSNIGN